MAKGYLFTKTKKLAAAVTCGSMLLTSAVASAAEWSDTSIGYRYGTTFHEPFNTNNISKNIYNLTHASGYKYGSNFFNVDFLMSDAKDPSGPGSTTGAQEAYVVYRHTLSVSKVTGASMKFGPIRDVGVTGGFDWNTKTDAGYNSKKRMGVFGPTISLDVPGFLDVSLLYLWESNAPCNNFNNPPVPKCVARYDYKTHPMLTAAWGIPIGDTPVSFQGFVNFIASKGRNEFGGATKAETNFDGAIMLDFGRATGVMPKNTLKVGFAYQYWKNKFGNDSSGAAGIGAFAKTPMVRVEYHF